MPLLKVNQLGQIEQCEMDYEETLGAIKTRSMVAIPTSVSSADRAAALAAVAAKDAEKTAVMNMSAEDLIAAGYMVQKFVNADGTPYKDPEPIIQYINEDGTPYVEPPPPPPPAPPLPVYVAPLPPEPLPPKIIKKTVVIKTPKKATEVAPAVPVLSNVESSLGPNGAPLQSSTPAANAAPAAPSAVSFKHPMAIFGLA